MRTFGSRRIASRPPDPLARINVAPPVGWVGLPGPWPPGAPRAAPAAAGRHDAGGPAARSWLPCGVANEQRCGDDADDSEVARTERDETTCFAWVHAGGRSEVLVSGRQDDHYATGLSPT